MLQKILSILIAMALGSSIGLRSGPILEQSRAEDIYKARAALKAKDLSTALELSRKAYEMGSDAESRAEALYLTGMIAEAAAEALSARAFREVRPRDGGYWDEDFVNWAGLKSYEALGLNFRWSHSGQIYEYDGSAFKTIVTKFLKTTWACSASFRLYVLNRPGGWEGEIKPALEEIAAMEDFLSKCPQPETKCAILYGLIRDYRYIADVYSNPRAPVFSDEKAEAAIKKAEVLLNQIGAEYAAWEDLAETASLRHDLKRSRERLEKTIRK